MFETLRLDAETGTEEAATDISNALIAGVGALGIVALVVGIALLIATVFFATRGNTPIAVLCGVALLTLILGPVVMLIIGIAAIVILAIIGNTPMIGPVAGGWAAGTLIYVIALIALGVVLTL